MPVKVSNYEWRELGFPATLVRAQDMLEPGEELAVVIQRNPDRLPDQIWVKPDTDKGYAEAIAKGFGVYAIRRYRERSEKPVRRAHPHTNGLGGRKGAEAK